MAADHHSRNFHFDPFSSEYEKDPHPTLKYLREHIPAYWWASGPGWLFTRYSDVVTILKDRRFSAEPALWERMPKKSESTMSEHEKLLQWMLFSLKAEDHARIRRLVGPSFSPKAAEQLRRPIELIVQNSLSKLPADGVFDLVTDFATNLPMDVMCHLLRVPEPLVPRFRQFGEALFRGTSARLTEEEKAKVSAPIAAGISMLRGFIEQRRTDLGDDLLSELLRSEQEGQVLSHDELIGLVASLVAAGMDTTIQHICYAAFHFMKSPEQFQLVRSGKTSLHNALEEVLRYDFFARTGPSRYAVEDVELCGVTIKKGQLVFPVLAAAMRDPAAFSDPDRFDVTREPGRNLSFGGGIYHCLGVSLARVEAQVAISALFDRFPKLHLAGAPQYRWEPFFRTFASIPVRAER